MQKNQPTSFDSWKKLRLLHQQLASTQISDLFAQNSNRFGDFSVNWEDFLVDFSKNLLTPKVLEALIELANEAGLQDEIAAMFSGQKINSTENRAVLHTALRAPRNACIEVEGENVIPQVYEVLDRVKSFVEQVHEGLLTGYTGKQIENIVNIGIGGSDLGMVMATEALKLYQIPHIQSYFVSNVDGSHIAEVLKKVDPETTLFIVASKTFTTQETMTNAFTAKQWVLDHLNAPEALNNHFCAVSTNVSEAVEFGILPQNVFGFWDWVGGRYSMWSAVGLSIALTIGFENFRQMLNGAHAMDVHYSKTDFSKNIPVILALIGVWHTNFCGYSSEAVLPYDQYLHRFPAYLQQSNMESNGKYVDRNGQQVSYQTGPIIWGEPGTNGQHAFYQLIHQGTQVVPCDFIAPAVSHNPIGDHHEKLLANFFAQSQALMNGRTEADVVAAGETNNKIAPFKVFTGNRPSNSILIQKITPYNLGALVAIYEHKIHAQGVIWNINSFDQFGVELGKKIASRVLPNVQNTAHTTQFDSSTNGLINQYKAFKLESNTH